MNFLNNLLVAAEVRMGVGTEAGTGAGAKVRLQDGTGPGEGETLPGGRFRQGERQARNPPGAILIDDLIDE